MLCHAVLMESNNYTGKSGFISELYKTTPLIKQLNDG